MRAPRRRALNGLPMTLALAVSLGLQGCASVPAVSPSPTYQHQILVTLGAESRPLWRVHTRELELAHNIRVDQSWRMRTLGVRCVVFNLPMGGSFQLKLRRLAADPRVEAAQAIQTFRSLSGEQGESNPRRPPEGRDPYAHLQAMRVATAHRWATGRGVVVAVVDTGVDVTHPELQRRVVRARNFVDLGERTFNQDIHGTAVAGIVGASDRNDIGIVGVAPAAGLMVLKACSPPPGASLEAVCDSYSLAKALDYALAEGARVVNLSLAGPEDPLLTRLIRHAAAEGVVVVAADSGDPASPFPASVDGVIAVRAGQPADGQPAAEGSSAAGELFAPGVDVLSTVPGGGFDFFSGSSMAAAHVSGVAALMLERAPSLSPVELARLLRAAARRSDGQLDACEALASVEPERVICPKEELGRPSSY